MRAIRIGQYERENRRQSGLFDRQLWTRKTGPLLSRTLRCRYGAVSGTVPANAEEALRVWPRFLRHEGRNCGHALRGPCAERVWRGVGRENRVDASTQ